MEIKGSTRNRQAYITKNCIYQLDRTNQEKKRRESNNDGEKKRTSITNEQQKERLELYDRARGQDEYKRIKAFVFYVNQTGHNQRHL